jgi:hypothetical protein
MPLVYDLILSLGVPEPSLIEEYQSVAVVEFDILKSYEIHALCEVDLFLGSLLVHFDPIHRGLERNESSHCSGMAVLVHDIGQGQIFLHFHLMNLQMVGTSKVANRGLQLQLNDGESGSVLEADLDSCCRVQFLRM